MERIITVGIPAYKAQKHIADCLASIQMQTIRDEVSVIIVSDYPDDDYSFTKKQYPNLDITIIPCEENVGPGLARQKALDACKTNWITFIDADDVFINPIALERLKMSITNECIEVQGAFYQEVTGHPQGIRMMPRNDITHPWVFGRLYNVNFLKANKICFSDLRAMEDGEFNWKIRMTIEGSRFVINRIEDPIYFWRVGSEHSITRIGVDSDGIPQYNFDLCQWGATEAAIRAVNFCRTTNPFNGSITRFITESMVNQYFTYVECLGRKPVFAKQNLFNAKKFYNECYKSIENQITSDILKQVYTQQMAGKAQDLIGIIPEITFADFMELVKTSEYGGDDEFESIRAELPEEIISNDVKSGVLKNINSK